MLLTSQVISFLLFPVRALFSLEKFIHLQVEIKHYILLLEVEMGGAKM